MARITWRVKLLSEQYAVYAPKECIGLLWKDDEDNMRFLPGYSEMYKGENEEYPYPEGIKLDPVTEWEVLS